MERYVMAIDDDQDDIFFVERSLHELGVKVYSFTSPVAPLALLATGLQRPPSHIFVDLNMPRIDGADVVRKIREIKELDDTVVVVWSTDMTDRSKKYLGALGADFALEKPSNIWDYKPILTHLFEDSTLQAVNMKRHGNRHYS
jgi:CheY-like chemotaxis protein